MIDTSLYEAHHGHGPRGYRRWTVSVTGGDVSFEFSLLGTYSRLETVVTTEFPAGTYQLQP